MQRVFYFFLVYLSFSIGIQAQDNLLFEVPGRSLYSTIDPAGISVLPSGRFVKPAGKLSRITHDPFGLALSPDGKKAVSLHNGVITIFHLDQDKVIRVPD